MSQPSKDDKRDPSFQPFKIAFYSSLGTMVGDMIMYPFDTIGTIIKANREEFLNFRQGFDKIVRNDSYRGLYRGFSTTILGSLLPYGTYFLLYEYLNRQAIKLTLKLDKEKYQHFNLLIPLITAPLAEIASIFSKQSQIFKYIAYIPFDTVRTRMQMNLPQYQYRGSIDGIIQIHRTEGLYRLFQASHMYIVQMIMFTGLQFWFFELLRFSFLHFRNGEQRKQLRLMESLSASMISTMMAGFIVNPIDVLITRFQLLDLRKQQLSFKFLFNDLINKEGKQALLKGLGARLIQQSVFALFYLPVYDYFKTKYGIILDD